MKKFDILVVQVINIINLNPLQRNEQDQIILAIRLLHPSVVSENVLQCKKLDFDILSSLGTSANL